MSTKSKAPKLPGTLTDARVAWHANRKTIEAQRATIAKLRKELERVRDACHENWENAERYKRGWSETQRTCETIERLYNTLANAIGRKV